jgi:hypothetical protein
MVLAMYAIDPPLQRATSPSGSDDAVRAGVGDGELGASDASRLLIAALSDRPCQAQQVLHMMDLYDREKRHFPTAGQARANGMHRARGYDVRPKLGSTFRQWVSNQTKTAISTVNRLWQFHVIDRTVLERVAEQVPPHGQGELLKALVVEVKSNGIAADQQMAIAEEWKPKVRYSSKAATSANPICTAFERAYNAGNERERAEAAIWIASFLREKQSGGR